MQVKVSYVMVQITEVEITEEMIRELYDTYKNSASARSMVMASIDTYLDRESGYIDNEGMDFECDTDIEQWVDEIIDKIKMEEE